MNVLSLFDGMSCGRIALERAGIKVYNYFASEIDKYAIQVSKHNYPDIIHLGDVEEWEKWELPKIDLIIGGSPCQGFSFAGKGLNFEDPRSKLFFKFVDILEHYKPNYFMLENVKMKKESENVITEILGVEPIEINSALFSAQNRLRKYWTNINLENEIIDKGIFLPEKIIGAAIRGRYNEKGETYQKLELRKDKKANCLTTVNKDSLKFNGVDVESFTMNEKEWLQTVPEGYTSIVSDGQRSKMLGNGWTVDVIAHILNNMEV